MAIPLQAQTWVLALVGKFFIVGLLIVEGVMSGALKQFFSNFSWVVFVFISSCSCVEQHDPVPDWNRQVEESRNANRPVQALADDGSLPVAAVADNNAKSPIDAKFEQFCASCHGAAGAGDGPAAAALQPPPRNFTDKDWQAKVDDARILAVIKDGGAANGLAATMGPWGSVLNAEELQAMVAKIRAFGQ